jgi:hypothetical protein
LSATVTVKLQLAVPAVLVAVQLTVVVPTGKVWGEVITVAPILHSIVGVGVPVAVTVKETEAEHCPESAFVFTFGEHDIEGTSEGGTDSSHTGPRTQA